jgi:phosphoglycolate phosphatase-like HAD superfamily hydrolase
MSPPTVFLFDIDGTLIDAGGAGRGAMEVAFVEVLGAARSTIAGVKFAGATDRGIVRAGLRAAGLPEDEAKIDAVLERYLELLPEEIGAARDAYRIHAGVHEAIAAAEAHACGAVGLGTGNVARGARIKLESVGIWERFAFGGFGCDAEPRHEVLAAGVRRGAARLAVEVEACRVVVIGDTPRDVEAARAIGAQCLAVSTGFASASTLREAGATWVVGRLDDAAAMRAIARG